jgi:hypothetical protein
MQKAFDKIRKHQGKKCIKNQQNEGSQANFPKEAIIKTKIHQKRNSDEPKNG